MRSDMVRVSEVYASIQGEGCLSGTPMTLIRLQGCSVGCAWCDTKHTWDHAGGTLSTVRAVCGEVRTPWALLTGGEPGEQPTAKLIAALQKQGTQVAVETSGWGPHAEDLCAADWLCLSPKVGHTGKAPSPAVVQAAHEVKWVVGKPQHLDDLRSFLIEFTPSGTISVQPVSANRTATELCVAAVLENPTWRLSIQTHKLIGLR